MYDFHYNFIRKRFDSGLLFTDTDSLTYEIKSGDVYEEFYKHKHLFDFSNFSKHSKFYNSKNKMVVGKMKFEYKGILISKFVGLKSKMHSMLLKYGKESNTAKGINTVIEFNEFRETLFNKKLIGAYEINKISLSCFDDKRLVLDDGIHTLAYYHKDLRKQILTDNHKDSQR